MGNDRSIVCSVVIPAYNCEQFIEDCIRSACGQTVSEIEIIVVDDASSDNTGGTVKALAENDERIRYIRLPVNSGPSAARNAGVEASEAELVAFLDSDDAWMEDKLQKQLELMDSSGAGFIYTGAYFISKSSTCGELSKQKGKVIEVPVKITANELRTGSDIICSSVLVKKELLKSFPFERDDLHEDLICWYKLLSSGAAAAGINEPLTVRRVTDSSKSSDKLRSAKATWNTYKYLNIPLFKRVCGFAAYALHGIIRYKL